MKDGDTYRGWKITNVEMPKSSWTIWGARRGVILCSPICTRRDNAIRALKRVIDDQERGREQRLFAHKHAALLLAAHSLPASSYAEYADAGANA